ncbi:MAG: hypothetical protein GWO04_36360, partial [Actinobacteria bacterium]|nr:hypothetical protein [Actinomycetota bacterium]NIW31683.1 hypothetical protein [Actinomycetota bacterium]
DPADVAALEAIDGVAAAEPVLEVPVSFTAGDRHYDTALVVMEPDTSMHRFAAAGGGWVELPEDGLLAGKALENLLAIEP